MAREWYGHMSTIQTTCVNTRCINWPSLQDVAHQYASKLSCLTTTLGFWIGMLVLALLASAGILLGPIRSSSWLQHPPTPSPPPPAPPAPSPFLDRVFDQPQMRNGHSGTAHSTPPSAAFGVVLQLGALLLIMWVCAKTSSVQQWEQQSQPNSAKVGIGAVGTRRNRRSAGEASTSVAQQPEGSGRSSGSSSSTCCRSTAQAHTCPPSSISTEALAARAEGCRVDVPSSVSPTWRYPLQQTEDCHFVHPPGSTEVLGAATHACSMDTMQPSSPAYYMHTASAVQCSPVQRIRTPAQYSPPHTCSRSPSTRDGIDSSSTPSRVHRLVNPSVAAWAGDVRNSGRVDRRTYML